jgi:small subunit ribosomal protein S16
MGSKKKPFYRLVAADSRMARDGRFIETLGYYNPVATPAQVHVDEASVFKWFERGAIPSTSVKSLLRQLGFMQKWELMKGGATAEHLETRVDAIKAQQEKASARRESKKRGTLSAKAKAKRSTEAAAAAPETPPATE